MSAICIATSAVREDHAQPFHVANWKVAITPYQPPRYRSLTTS